MNGNWYKRASSTKQPLQADPNEVGYQSDWGDHHGPVSYVPDRWNYGPNGYPGDSPPMPMPRKMYHVTMAPDAIQQEGFKTFTDPSQQTFGGHGTYVSFTSLNDAKTYQKALYTVWEVANGMLSKEDLPALAKTWGVKSDAAAGKWAEVQRTAEVRKSMNHPMTFEQMVLEYLSMLSHTSEESRWPNSPRFPILFGTGKNLLQKMRGMDARQIAVMEAEVPEPMEWHNGVNVFHNTDMKGKYTYNRHENEWRVWEPSRIPTEKIKRVL